MRNYSSILTNFTLYLHRIEKHLLAKGSTYTMDLQTLSNCKFNMSNDKAVKWGLFITESIYICIKMPSSVNGEKTNGKSNLSMLYERISPLFNINHCKLYNSCRLKDSLSLLFSNHYIT